MGRIPNYGRNNCADSMRCGPDPPACVQNAMMTKDKKPFTYTPGGLDLSQIRTPSMARRLNKQQQLSDEQDSPTSKYAPQLPGPVQLGRGGPTSAGGPPPPPPPMPAAKIPAPPPPPPLVIQAPNAKSPKPIPLGERPEIVIPENPIGMLRKTNSPYHWESEMADRIRSGDTPKFVEKTVTPTPEINRYVPPTQFSQQPPQVFLQRQPSNGQHYQPSYYNNNNNSAPTLESPVHKPQPKYPEPPSSAHNTPTREMLVRQDSQFNKSPAPWSQDSPRSTPVYSNEPKQYSPVNQSSTSSPFARNSDSLWKQPEVRNSPLVLQNNISNSISQQARSPYSEVSVRDDNKININSPILSYNSSPASRTPVSPPQYRNEVSPKNVSPYSPFKEYHPTASPGNQNGNAIYSNPNEYSNNSPNQTPWRNTTNQTQSPISQANQSPPEVRYQTRMTIPVTPRTKPQENTISNDREVVIVSQEPVYYGKPESPKVVPPWVRGQKDKTPPPEWCRRPADNTESEPREIRSQSVNNSYQPESPSPPQSQQPPWYSKPSENRKSIPRDEPANKFVQQKSSTAEYDNREVPIQMQVNSKEASKNQGDTLRRQEQPQLRIIIDMNQQQPSPNNQTPSSQPSQRIIRALQPQLVRLDRNNEAPANNTTIPGQHQPVTRIIPIQMEPSSPVTSHNRYPVNGRF